MRRDNKNETNYETDSSKCGVSCPPLIQAEAVCDYIQAIANEMSQLAKESGIISLSNLLSLTSAEANSVKSKLASTKRKKDGSGTAAH